MTYTVIRGSWGPGAWEDTVEEERRILAEVDASLEVVPIADREAIAAALPRADGVLGISQLPAERLRLLEQARGIVTVSHGFNYIDLDVATELGLPVGNEFYCHREVASHTILLLLAWVRKLIPLHNHLVAGRWRRDLQPPVNRIYGETLGLVGFGHIGREVARRARGFDLRILAHDPFVSPEVAAEHGAELVELDDLLRRSDYVSLHAPAADQTRHLIGDRELGLMKPSAAIFNTARGDLIDEAALHRALVERRIAGAGLDVFEQEPAAPDNPLIGLDNVILTPHAAGYSDEAVRDGYRQGARDMVRILTGRWPSNLCNPEVRGKTRFAFTD
jgi:D-3-phosphoglycerate dehydrogenase